MKIDLVIAYVDNKDIVWRNTFINYCKKNRLQEQIVQLATIRYSGIRFIDYQLKLVAKNMPWINNIYLLLSNIEQKPHNLPSNCKVVLHKDFIPFKYLPTFNSTTIEMFLWNIKGLEEHFIYANDDMLPIGKLYPSDFFEKDKIKINWRERELKSSMGIYTNQCWNNCLAITKELNIKWKNGHIILPEHSFTPMIKSHCVESYNLIKKYIEPHIRAFRTNYQYNQYIYPLYEYFKYGTLPTNIDFYYTELDKDFDFNHQIMCFNLEKNKEYVKKFILGIEELCL